MGYERVTLYGVPLATDRLVSFGKVDPVLARELFIRHALVYGEWHTRQSFFAANRQLLEEAEELEHRARRRGIVVDEHTLFDFYDDRVGEGVVSGAHFDTWWKQERRRRPDLLTFDPAMLVQEGADGDHRRGLPRHLAGGVTERCPCAITSSPATRATASPSTYPSPRSTRSTPRRSPGRCRACARSW